MTDPDVVQQTTVIQVGNRKSVLGAVLLAFFFGPLGMLYSTSVGALVMFVVSLIVVILTLGLGLILTVPMCAIWAGIAASNHNDNLGAVSNQAVGHGASPPPAGVPPLTAGSPAGWYDNPEDDGRLGFLARKTATSQADEYDDSQGGGRLRYWDGSQVDRLLLRATRRRRRDRR